MTFANFAPLAKKLTTILVCGNASFKRYESVCNLMGIDSICSRSLCKRTPLEGLLESSANTNKVFGTSIVEPYPLELCALRDD